MIVCYEDTITYRNPDSTVKYGSTKMQGIALSSCVFLIIIF